MKRYLNFLKLARQRAHKAHLARRDSLLLYLTTQRNASSRQSQGAKVAKGEKGGKKNTVEEQGEKKREGEGKDRAYSRRGARGEGLLRPRKQFPLRAMIKINEFHKTEGMQYVQRW